MTWRGTSQSFVVAVVSGGHFLSHFYLLALPPLFPFLLADFELSSAQLGGAVSAIYLSMFLFQTPVGFLVDVVGAKRVFVGGTAVTAAGIGMIGLADTYLLLLAGAFVSGVGQAAFHPADYALLSAVSPEGQEGKSYGIHLFAGYVGFAIVPLVMAGLAVRFSWQLALLSTAAVGIAYAAFSGISMGAVYRDQIDADRSSSGTLASFREDIRALADVRILLLFSIYLTVTMGAVGIQTFTPLLLVEQFDFTEFAGNFSLTAFLALAAVGVLAGGAIADRYDASRAMLLALLGAGVATFLALLPAMQHAAVAIGVFSLVGLLYGIVLPMRDYLVNAVVPPDARGKNFGFVYTGLPLGGFISPVILGSVIDVGLPLLVFGIVGGFFLLTAVTVRYMATMA